MAAFVALIVMWILAFVLVSTPEGALALIVITTSAILGLGTRLNPQGGILATVAVLLGVWLSAQEWAPILTVAVLATLAIVLVSSLRPHPPHRPA